MVRGLMANILSPVELNAIFRETAERQYESSLLFSTVVDLLSLVVSKALSLAEGTIASGANRYDADTIAKYEFQTGSGSTAYDTSGIDPAGPTSAETNASRPRISILMPPTSGTSSTRESA